MPPRLTPRRTDILKLIKRLARDLGRPITITELADALGMSKQGVQDHLSSLTALGLVERSRGRYGTLNITTQGERAIGYIHGLPLLGHIAAGPPSDAQQHVEHIIEDLATFLGVKPGDFLLRVRGDSMIGDGIRDGDLVLVRPTNEVPDGQIAVVLIPGENAATLKRLYRHGRQVTLVSSNDLITPLQLPAASVQIQGCYLRHIGAAERRRAFTERPTAAR